ncbi:hypothetical protein EIP86_007863 [Pleurotus ostreatoroseus]|nr:hypothetical protein EIP86_007863 [Pleurotus ostreatoroseus]
MPAVRRQQTFRPRFIPCPVETCKRHFTNTSGLKRHISSSHPPRPSIPSNSEFGDLQNLAGVFANEDNEDTEMESEERLEEGIEDPQPSDSSDTAQNGNHVEFHPYLDGIPCDEAGNDLPAGSPPPPPSAHPKEYTPFSDRPEFELADFFFRKVQMSASRIDELMQLWASTLPPGFRPPFADSGDLYNAIDSIGVGEVPWQCFVVTYTGPRPAENVPAWMDAEFEVWFRCPRAILRNQIGNPDFAQEMDYAPKQVYDGNNKRQYKDFMSGNWVWRQANKVAQNPAMHGAVYCPVVAGSDKTTVSVATGQNEYYPLYVSNGLVHNTVRRAHRNAVTLCAFLAIPKTDREYKNDPKFRKFRRQLFHSSLNYIFQSLKPSMTAPEVTRCADGHYRRIVYGLGPYIADYPEQALLACIYICRCTAPHDDLDGGHAGRRSHEHTQILLDALDAKVLWDDYGIVADLIPFTAGFPYADIHELLSPDILHQIIKGTFKDHLVTWVEEYLVQEHGKAGAAAILADIDRRIAAVPSFPGLRRFPEGRGFKQWTGDDSKALMKVYLPAIAGHVPPQMVRAVSAFLEFCYLVRQDMIDEDGLEAIRLVLARFHEERVIFENVGVRAEGFSLPRQHSLSHYADLIPDFAAPNGLCSSITESKHIKAVKEPWRRSSRFQALGQMLLTNQRLDKLAAARVDFAERGMLEGPCTQIPAFILEMTGLREGDTEDQSHQDFVTGPLDTDEQDDEDDEDDEGAVDGMIEAEVKLAKCPGMFHVDVWCGMQLIHTL